VLNRRWVLGSLAAGGALVLGWGIAPPRQRLKSRQAVPTAERQHALNGWVRIGSDDQVQVVLARSEMGQGVSTALAMLLADELDADWDRVQTTDAPVDAIYNNLAVGVDGLPFHPDDHGWVRQLAGWLTAKTLREIGLMATGGSTSIKDLWHPMREAGASARAMLLAAAAEAWSLPSSELSVSRGVVRHNNTGRQARFGELAERAARRPLPRQVALKTPAQFALIGREIGRRDAAAKQDGSARFGIDTVLPGMRHATVVMSPRFGGRLASFDPAPALAVPGVVKVLAVPGQHGASDALAVVADTPWHALKAARLVAITWAEGPAGSAGSPPLQDTAAIDQALAQALGADQGHTYHRKGDVEQALAGAARSLQADYRAPLLAHATLEPQNCTVEFDAQARLARVWAPTQVPDLARRAAAQALGLEPDQVHVKVTLLGGGFGRRLETDFIAQAAAIAKAVPGAPVQTFWSREQDTTHDFYRPPAAARWRAGFDASGQLLGVSALSAGPSVVQQFVQRQFDLPAMGPDKTSAEGMFDQPYAWPAARFRHQNLPLAVPVGFWRSVGHSHQAFFKESFVDECAHASGRDPLAFRVALLAQQPRALAVLQRAASLAGWGQPSAPAADGEPTAWGLALHRSFGSTVAQVAQVSVDPAEPRRIRVHQVVAVIDCGTVVNPGLVRQQLEGAIVFGLSAALHGEVTLKQGQVQQSNFHDQPLLRLSDCPQIRTELMPSDAGPEGVGEPGVPPIAPAVANAVFKLTGQRLRSLPLRLA